MLYEKGVKVDSDQLLLRYLYSSDLKVNDCIEKLLNHNKWFEDEEIQVLTKSGLAVLRTGFIYSEYKNKEGRAVVVMDVSSIDLNKYSHNDYNQAMNCILNKVIEEDFIPGQIESYEIILDTRGKLVSLPITSLSAIIKQLSDVYSMRMSRMYVVNCNLAIKFLHRALSSFIA
jgi:hypothetical protein